MCVKKVLFVVIFYFNLNQIFQYCDNDLEIILRNIYPFRCLISLTVREPKISQQ